MFSENYDQTKTGLNSIESKKVFQLFSKYIVLPLKSSLLIISQSRAHQRVLYERFLSGITSKKISSQNLVFPINIDIKTTTSTNDERSNFFHSVPKTQFPYVASNYPH